MRTAIDFAQDTFIALQAGEEIVLGAIWSTDGNGVWFDVVEPAADGQFYRETDTLFVDDRTWFNAKVAWEDKWPAGVEHTLKGWLSWWRSRP